MAVRVGRLEHGFKGLLMSVCVSDCVCHSRKGHPPYFISNNISQSGDGPCGRIKCFQDDVDKAKSHDHYVCIIVTNKRVHTTGLYYV